MLIPLSLFAQNPKSLVHNTNSYVDDFANVLSDEDESELNFKLRGFFDTVQISVVTVNSLDGLEVSDYGTQLFKHWGIGQKGSNNGLLILIAPNEHKSVMRTGYGIEGDMPDGVSGEILRSANPYFKNNDFYGGINGIVEQSIATLSPSAKALKAEATAAKQKIQEKESAETNETLGYVFLCLLGLGLIGFLIYRYYSKQQEIKNKAKEAEINFNGVMSFLERSREELLPKIRKYSKYLKIDIEEPFNELALYQIKRKSFKTAEDFDFATKQLGPAQNKITALKKDITIVKSILDFMSTVSYLPSTVTDTYQKYLTHENSPLIFGEDNRQKYLSRYEEMVKNYQKEYTKLDSILCSKNVGELTRQMDNVNLAKDAINAIKENIGLLRDKNRDYIQQAKDGKRQLTARLKEAQEWNARKGEVDSRFYSIAMTNQLMLQDGIAKFNGDIIHDFKLYENLKNIDCFAIRSEIIRIENAEKARLAEIARKKADEERRERERLQRIRDEEEAEERRRRRAEEDRNSYTSSSYSSSYSSSSWDSGSSSSSSDSSFSGGDSGGGGSDSSW